MNLRTYLERIIGNAGHTLWARLLQNLRASCSTDWVEKYPSHVVAKWLGHSPKVAAQHSLMSRDHHFEDVVGGGDSSTLAGADAGQGSQSECDTKCASIATRNATRFRLVASSCSLGRWSSWRACGFQRQRGRQCWQDSRPTDSPMEKWENGQETRSAAREAAGKGKEPAAETVWASENVQPKVIMSRCGGRGTISSSPLSDPGTPPSRPNSNAISNLCRYVSIWWLRGCGVPRPFPKSRERHGHG